MSINSYFIYICIYIIFLINHIPNLICIKLEATVASPTAFDTLIKVTEVAQESDAIKYSADSKLAGIIKN